ncbi:MAG: threonylcarbamoyl-AMP synthase [Muribaculaceae bacterium]|nr:threonylcarbamoyl-AMP synthase [Muribaculaceae bacterium]
MEHLTVYPSSINERAIDRAVEAVNDDELVVYPTDTLYALGCNALSNCAIERLCAAKGINPDKQLLSIVCADISQAAEYARIDNRTFAILKRHLPGPFTFILPASTRLPKVFKGRKTVGIRVPDQPVAIALTRAVGHPILSASVAVDPEDPEQAANPASLAMEYESVASLIIDSGEGGTEPSTIVDLTDSSDPVVTRQGKGVFDN